MNGNGQARSGWGLALERPAAPLLQAALRSVGRTAPAPTPLPECTGEACRWVRAVADCLARGDCRGAVLFCDDPGAAACIANKVKGIRAVAVTSLPEAEKALRGVGANLLVVPPAGRTFYEYKELLRLCCGSDKAACPPGVACVLEELDGHAHR